MRHFNSALEEYSVVVNWDQRGAGKSYTVDLPADMFTIQQFVDDPLALAVLLTERSNTSEIYLLGHS